MRRLLWHYILTREDAARLLAVLARRSGSLSPRDLERRHRLWNHAVLEATAAAGFIHFEKHSPAPTIFTL